MSKKRLKFDGFSPLNLGASLARGLGISLVLDMVLIGIFGVVVGGGVGVGSCSKIAWFEVCGWSRTGVSSLGRFLCISKFASILSDVLFRRLLLAEDDIDFLGRLE